MNMNSLLSISKTGLTQLQKALDTTASNIANVNTTGYKAKDMSFRELLNNPTSQNEVDRPANTQNIDFNAGIQTNGQTVNFVQGSLNNTGILTDLAIAGEGFFAVRDANGNQLLTRDGSFRLDAQHRLVTQKGLPVEVNYTVNPAQWPNTTIAVSQQGIITAKQGDQTIELGRIPLFLPTNTNRLVPQGENLYQIEPGTQLWNNQQNPERFGAIQQGFLENAAVNLAQEMTDMIVTQRAFSLNAKALQTTDDMFNVINHFTDK